MSEIKLALEQANEVARDTKDEGDELRALKDLELVLVGGGSDALPVWP